MTSRYGRVFPSTNPFLGNLPVTRGRLCGTLLSLLLARTGSWRNSGVTSDFETTQSNCSTTELLTWYPVINCCDCNSFDDQFTRRFSSGLPLHWRHNGHDGVSNHHHSRLFTQSFIQAQIKQNIKAPRQWPLGGEFTGDQWIPRTKDQ